MRRKLKRVIRNEPWEICSAIDRKRLGGSTVGKHEANQRRCSFPMCLHYAQLGMLMSSDLVIPAVGSKVSPCTLKIWVSRTTITAILPSEFWGRGSSGTDESMDGLTMTGDPKAPGWNWRIGVRETERMHDGGPNDSIPDDL